MRRAHPCQTVLCMHGSGYLRDPQRHCICVGSQPASLIAPFLLLTYRHEPLRKGQKRPLREKPSASVRRVTRRLASHSADDISEAPAPTLPAASTRPFTRGLLSNTQSLPATTSAPHPARAAATSAAAAATPTAAAASKAATRAAAASTGKPPLPPSAYKAATAYKAARREAPVGSQAALKATVAHSAGRREKPAVPHTAPAGSHSRAGLPAAATVAIGTDPDMPVATRRATLQSAKFSIASPSDADDLSPRQTRSRSRSLGPEGSKGKPGAQAAASKKRKRADDTGLSQGRHAREIDRQLSCPLLCSSLCCVSLFAVQS